MSKTDELKKLALKITGTTPSSRRASDIVEYIADYISGNIENTQTISEAIKYLTDVYEGGGSGEDMGEIKKLIDNSLAFDFSDIEYTSLDGGDVMEYIYEVESNADNNYLYSNEIYQLCCLLIPDYNHFDYSEHTSGYISSEYIGMNAIKFKINDKEKYASFYSSGVSAMGKDGDDYYGFQFSMNNAKWQNGESDNIHQIDFTYKTNADGDVKIRCELYIDK